MFAHRKDHGVSHLKSHLNFLRDAHQRKTRTFSRAKIINPHKSEPYNTGKCYTEIKQSNNAQPAFAPVQKDSSSPADMDPHRTCATPLKSTFQ